MNNFRDLVLSRWGLISSRQRTQTIYGALGLLAILASLSWWTLRPSWAILYSGLTPDEARQIATVLSSANMVYEVSNDGTILRVPSEELDKARLTSASKASGKSGRLGYELFDKPDWAGSDFDEKVNYQRALEGELEKTIDSISDVEASSVHLVLPHDSLFSETQRDSKASVVIKLKSKELSRDEAQSIKALVANAVDDLSVDNVALIDADGRTLGGRSSSADSRDLYEHSLTDHILETLEPIVGVGNVHATVSIDYDLFSHDTVNEDYDPASVVTLSMQRSEQTLGESIPASGIPGTASNTSEQKVPLFPSQKPASQSSKQESGTYGASKKTEHSLESAGSIRRLTAAVLVNDKVLPSTDPKKPPLTRAWTQDEMKQLSNLSQAAVGYDLSRGDSVVVQNLHFEPNIVQRQSFLNGFTHHISLGEPIIKDVSAALIALCALFFVVRPAIFAMKTSLTEAPIIRVIANGVSPASEEGALEPGHSRGLFDQVVAQIQSDPSQSARVLQTWIRSE